MSTSKIQPESIQISEESLEVGLAAAFAPPGTAAHAHGGKSPPLGRLAQRRVVLRDSEQSEAPRLQSHQAPGVLDSSGRYELLGEIGHGGMGTVFWARDTQLGRELAVKVLGERFRNQPLAYERFVEEAQIAGQMQHPGIVPIHELGQFDDGRPFMTMKLVRGQTLAQLLAARPDASQDRPRFLGIFEQICQTLAYAHSRGVIHRDLKPTNIMVGAFGEVQVMDWGLAKVLTQVEFELASQSLAERQAAPSPDGTQTKDKDTDNKLGGDTPSATRLATHAGTIMGTPAYVSPEQAQGAVERTDQRSDVFGLGAILCEILSGLPPYVGEDGAETKQKAKNADLAEAFRRLDQCGADDELILLTKRCLDGNPARRPQDAGELANGISEYLRSVDTRWRQAELENVAARARATHERKLRRMTVVLAAVVLLFGALIAGGWLWVQQDRHRQITGANRRLQAEKSRADKKADEAGRERLRAERAHGEAQRQRDNAERQFYLQCLSSAQFAWEAGDAVQAWANLNASREDLRGWEHRYLKTRFTRDHETLGSHTGAVDCVAFSPDGSRIVSAGRDMTLKLWDAGTGEQLRTLEGHAWPVHCVAFSPDGSRIVSGGGMRDGTLRLWDAASGELKLTIPGNPVHGVAYSPDGSRIASVGHRDSTITLRDAVTGALMLTFRQATRFITCVAFSPDGGRIVSGGGDKTLKLWDVGRGEEILTLQGQTGVVTCVAFSPHGDHIVSGSHDKTLKVWDAHSGRERFTLRHGDVVNGVAFSRDGGRIVSGGRDRTVKVWDANTGQLIETFKGHTHTVLAVAISPDGSRIVSGSFDQTLKLWNVGAADERFTLDGHGRIRCLAFSPDGTRIVTDNYPTGENLKMWDASTGRNILPLKGHTAAVLALAFRPGAIPVVGIRRIDGTLICWDALTGEPTWSREQAGSILGAAFHPAGNRVVTASSATASGAPGEVSTLKLRDVRSGEETVTWMEHAGAVYCLAFSRDGSRIVSGSSDHTLKLWDAHSGEQTAILKGHTGRVNCAAFHPDGSRLVSGSDDKTLKLWDARTGAELRTLERHTSGVRAVAFSPDGSLIVSGGFGLLVWWDARTGGETLVVKGHTNYVDALAFSPDGSRIFSVCDRDRVKLWDASGDSGLSRWRRAAASAPPDAVAEHEYRAALGEKMDDWYAAAFHLGWLIALNHDDPSLSERRATAVARLRERGLAIPTITPSPSGRGPG